MPETQVIIYKEENGAVPLIDWLDKLDKKSRVKCIVAIEQLELQGRDLRRPQADYLRNGIYELRVQRQGMQYRVLYGFVGKDVILLTHGLTKERAVPAREIGLARVRLDKARRNPETHTVSA
ncbi:MAG: type II toxin-antitoxin system RelE/ParE family toxin [Candidatus Hydrogenedentota bacterium]